MKNSSDCPGKLKCHGPASWCDQCGDVDQICDDPECMVHLRMDELERNEAELRRVMVDARRHCDESMTLWLAEKERFEEAKKRPRCVVARKS